MHNSSAPNPALISLLMVPLVVGFWMLVTYSVSWITGWHELARRFAMQGNFPCEKWRFKTALTRYSSHYSNCLTIGASPVGFYIATFWLFRPGHPPLFIPWNEISYSRTKTLWARMVKFQLGRENPVPFAVRAELAEKIRVAARASWPVERIE